jgi:preprotein translocase subunit SecF
MRLKNPFLWKHYQKLFIIPLALLAVSLFLIFVHPKVTYGLDFKGGTLLTVMTSAQNPDLALIRQKLAPFSFSVAVRQFTAPDGGNGVEISLGPSEQLEAAAATVRDLDAKKAELDSATIDLTIMESQVESGKTTPDQLADQQKKVDGLKASVGEISSELLSDLKESTVLPGNPAQAYQIARDKYAARQSSYQDAVLAAVKSVMPVSSYSAREVGSSLSKQFLSQVIQILVYSFLICSVIVFVIFRSLLPSFSVVFGAVSDIVITLGVMAAIGLPLTLATFAALLMLIAFSVDTDVLLAVRVLKRTDATPEERAFEAMKAALLMNLAVVLAYSVLLGTSVVLQISTYYELASVAVIGGLVDFIATWMFNAPLILRFSKRSG